MDVAVVLNKVKGSLLPMQKPGRKNGIRRLGLTTALRYGVTDNDKLRLSFIRCPLYLWQSSLSFNLPYLQRLCNISIERSLFGHALSVGAAKGRREIRCSLRAVIRLLNTLG